MSRKPHLKLLLALMVLATVNRAGAQVDPALESLRNILPPSPNASALGRYSEWPVSLYTGVPEISIPIYELQGRKVRLPISLSYHASGNRVGDVASWVGLGWSLNTGGVISRSVRGLPDEDSYFTYANTYSDPNNFQSVSNISGGTQRHQVDAAKQNGDSQQDIYTLSAMGKSYRLLLKADGSVTTMPFSNLKISYSMPNSWTVIMEDGTRLAFGGASGFQEVNTATYGMAAGGVQYPSSWYLQSITSPAGEKVNFTYTTSSITQDIHFTQSDFIQYKSSSNASNATSNCQLVTNSNVATHIQNETVSVLSPATIESDQTKIVFVPTSATRLDLQGGVALSEIRVIAKPTGKLVADYLLNYTYTQAAVGNELTSNPLDTSFIHHRLRLVSVKQLATDNSSFKLWSFQYNPLNLPSRRSYAQDHSGFYNGATGNASLLPPVYFSLPQSSYWNDAFITSNGFMPTNNHLLGDNRGFNGTAMQAEILTRITYPTGGYTTFNYEPNSIPVTAEQFSASAINPVLNINANQPALTKSQTFTITKPQYIQLQFSTNISSTVWADQPTVKGYAVIQNSGGTTVVQLTSSGQISNKSGYFNLTAAGTYTLKIYTTVDFSDLTNPQTDYVNLNANLNYSNSLGSQSFNQMVGGLRVKSILNYDPANPQPANDRYFTYASGFVINPIDSLNDYMTTQTSTNLNAATGEICGYTKVTRNTSTKFSLGSIQGGVIGYGTVTTLYGPAGENGKTVSAFSNVADNGVTNAKLFPYPPTDPREWRRGLLLDETSFSASAQAVRKVRNTYSFQFSTQVINFAAGYQSIVDPTQCTDQYQYCGIIARPFNISSEIVFHNSTSETTYGNAVQDSVSTTTNFYYDNPLTNLLTRSVTTDSRGNRHVSKATYPQDYIIGSYTGNAVLDSLIGRNIVASVIEKRDSLYYSGSSTGYVTGASLSRYRQLASGVMAPDKEYKLDVPNPVTNFVPMSVSGSTVNQDSRYRQLVSFDAYDAKNNIAQYTVTGQLPVSVLWDYRGMSPIVQVKNADTTNIAYTSFEAEGKGRWTVPSALRDSLTATISGIKSYNLANGAISKAGLTAATTYIVSYWTKSATPLTIAGTISGYPVNGIATKGWYYHEHRVTGVTSVSLTGTGNIDEVRLYPLGAQMVSYTYTPLIGVSSSADARSGLSFYDYDGLQRLLNIRDQDGNILKSYDYNYRP